MKNTKNLVQIFLFVLIFPNAITDILLEVIPSRYLEFNKTVDFECSATAGNPFKTRELLIADKRGGRYYPCCTCDDISQKCEKKCPSFSVNCDNEQFIIAASGPISNFTHYYKCEFDDQESNETILIEYGKYTIII